MIANPLIRKELTQAAHHRLTYALRAGLPALAIVLLAPQVVRALEVHGRDWRALAAVSRDLFPTSAWLQLIAFSLLAFSYATATVHDEWTRQTMEVLCASPLTHRQMLYGKFVGVLSKVLMMAVALLPITAILFYMGRMPRAMALGSIAVVLGSVLLFASLGLACGAAVKPRHARSSGPLAMVLLCFALLWVLDAFVWVRHPVLEAVIPFKALYRVLTASPPGAMSLGGFATLSFFLMAGVGGAALGCAPWLFGRTYARHIGEAVVVRRLGGWRRLLAGPPRPPMRPDEDPFAWQERGPATRLLRWALWVVYGLLSCFYLVGAIATWDLGFMDEEALASTFLGLGTATVVLASAFYGTRVFAREKVQRTNHALLLTGNHPSSIFRAKIWATYRALRWSLLGVVVPVLFIWGIPWGGRGEMAVTLVGAIAFVATALLGPGIAVLVGMVFSSAAKSPQQASRALLLSVLWCFILGFLFVPLFPIAWLFFLVPGVGLLPVLGVIWVFVKVNRTWTPWRLSLLLALTYYCGTNGAALLAMVGAGGMTGYGRSSGILGAVLVLWLVGGTALVAAFVVFWWQLGVRIFDDGMAREPAETRPSSPLRAA